MFQGATGAAAAAACDANLAAETATCEAVAEATWRQRQRPPPQGGNP